MKILLHTCCAPCSIKCVETLKKDFTDLDLFWFNPNIHPFKEYESRKNSLINYYKSENSNVIIDDNYGLKFFINKIYPDFSNNRCSKCYEIRLEKTAIYAKNNGYDYFSTTLLISPYQNHDLIKDIANYFSNKYNIKFFYVDLRNHFRESLSIARNSNLYMQKYCGCIFSEEERYLKK